MTADRPADYLVSLVRELCKLPQETEWVEFKVNNAEPQEIGEYISALANSATLTGKAFAYLVWGVANGDHTIVGTHFLPHAAKVGNEELENWLLRLLAPKIHFRFFEVSIEGQPVVLLEIERAFRHPVQFQGVELIRIGSYKKRLKDFPEKERALWRIFDRMPFEDGIAAERAQDDEVLRLLDYPAYFDLLKRPLPENRDGILRALADDSLIRPCEAGGWNVTNLGAILFAKRLEDFGSLPRKAMRVIQYRGASRVDTIKEQVGARGYASGFEGLIGFINGLLPSNEVIEQALRKTVPMFPELAVRELVANALIHQDFFVSGAGPMVEIFKNRIEITNPGEPLVDTQRFVDTPPKSRNEALASLMRRIGICEERGSGWDKVVFQTELYQLPAPLPEATGDHTRVVLFAPRPLSKMDKADRIRAVYLHACLRYVNREHMTNTSVRARFGIEPQNIAAASRLIREAVEAGFIVPYDPDAAPKLMRYLPAWAIPLRNLRT
ncbi:MAG: ATP-binding protein [Chloroflexia bacterium]